MKRFLSFLNCLFPLRWSHLCWHHGEEKFNRHAHTYTEREAHVARRREARTFTETLAQ